MGRVTEIEYCLDIDRHENLGGRRVDTQGLDRMWQASQDTIRMQIRIEDGL